MAAGSVQYGGGRGMAAGGHARAEGVLGRWELYRGGCCSAVGAVSRRARYRGVCGGAAGAVSRRARYCSRGELWHYSGATLDKLSGGSIPDGELHGERTAQYSPPSM